MRHVLGTPLDPRDGGEHRPARALVRSGHEHVTEPVADDRLGAAVQIGEHRHEPARLGVDQLAFDMHQVFVQVQRAMGAGDSEEALGGLVDLSDGQAEAALDPGCHVVVEHVRNRVDHRRPRPGRVAGEVVQHLRRSGQNRRRKGEQPLVDRLGGQGQIDVGERDPASADRLVERTAGPQHERHPYRFTQAGQRLREHRTCPAGLLLGRGEEHAAPSRGAGGQPDADPGQSRVETAGRLGRAGGGQALLQAQAAIVEAVEAAQPAFLVEDRKVSQRRALNLCVGGKGAARSGQDRAQPALLIPLQGLPGAEAPPAGGQQRGEHPPPINHERPPAPGGCSASSARAR